MISIHVKQRSVGAEKAGEDPQVATAVPTVMSRPLSILVALLKLTAQSGGAGCAQFLYALLMLGMASFACLVSGWESLILGIQKLTDGSKFFNALLTSAFFGLPSFLMWFTMAITFLFGRRRTGALLEEALEMLQDISVLPTFAEQRIRHNRRLYCMLSVVLFIWVVGVLSYIMMTIEIQAAFSMHGVDPFLSVLLIAISTVVFISFLMSSFKFALLCCISVCGIETVNSELKTLAEDDGPVSWSALRRLRLIQSRLSRGFSRVTEQLRPELISTISYGTLAQVITIFQLIGAAQQDEHIFIWSTILYLVPALVSTLVPCWSCQRVLDASEGTRAALLTVEPQDAPADRQLAALLAATQRDLETFGDLGFFRLQLSAILGTTSTVLTYIIIMVQFQMSENGCGDSGGHQGNTTDAA